MGRKSETEMDRLELMASFGKQIMRGSLNGIGTPNRCPLGRQMFKNGGQVGDIKFGDRALGVRAKKCIQKNG